MASATEKLLTHLENLKAVAQDCQTLSTMLVSLEQDIGVFVTKATPPDLDPVAPGGDEAKIVAKAVGKIRKSLSSFQPLLEEIQAAATVAAPKVEARISDHRKQGIS